MNCEMARALLDAYVDGELTAEQERALMDHVNACEHCKQEFEAAVLLKDILKDMDDDVAVPLEAQAAWRRAVRQEAKKKSVKKWTRWAYAAAAALVLVVGCTVALNIDQPDSVSLSQPEALVLGAGDALIARDGTQAQLVRTFGQEENFSARRKYEAADLASACKTIEQLAAEYSGIFVSERGEGETASYRIELPGDYMEDFLSAVSCVGAELDSETMDAAGDTAVVFIQIVAK